MKCYGCKYYDKGRCMAQKDAPTVYTNVLRCKNFKPSGKVLFSEVWQQLELEDKTGTFEKADVLAHITVEALEYAYNRGFEDGIKHFDEER